MGAKRRMPDIIMDTKQLAESENLILVSPAILRNLARVFNRTDTESFREAQNLFFLLVNTAVESDIQS